MVIGVCWLSHLFEIFVDCIVAEEGGERRGSQAGEWKRNACDRTGPALAAPVE